MKVQEKPQISIGLSEPGRDTCRQVVFQASNIDVKKVMDTWTLQMGYPVITLKRKNSQFTAEQTPFLLNPNSEHSQEYNSPFG